MQSSRPLSEKMKINKILSIALLFLATACSHETVNDSSLAMIKDKNRHVCLVSYKNNVIAHFNFNFDPFVSSNFYIEDDILYFSTNKESYSVKVTQNRIITVNKNGTISTKEIKKNINAFKDTDLFQKNHIVENILIKDSLEEVSQKLMK